MSTFGKADNNYEFRARNSDNPHFHDAFPIAFIILTAIGFLANGFCIFYCIAYKTYKRNVKYSLYLNYISLKLFYSIAVCASLLMSRRFAEASLHIKPTPLSCKLMHFVTFYVESAEIFFLAIMWLIILSERNLVNFRFLYADVMTTPPPVKNSIVINNDNSNNNNQQDLAPPYNIMYDSQLSFAKVKNWRLTILITYYACSLLICLFIMSGTINFYGHCVVMGIQGMFTTLSFVLIIMPIIYGLVVISVLFWKLFGAARDPLASKLTKSESSFLKFFKIVTILKGLEMIAMDVQSSNYFLMNAYMLEIFRTSALLIIIAESLLFMYYESMFASLRHILWPNAASAAAAMTSNDDHNNTATSSRANVRISRDDIDYTNLVESSGMPSSTDLLA